MRGQLLRSPLRTFSNVKAPAGTAGGSKAQAEERKFLDALQSLALNAEKAAK